MLSWIDKELIASKLPDKRLTKRLYDIMKKLFQGIGESIPTAFQDWANTKAAYRFLGNPRVNEADILKGHFEATKSRVQQTNGILLVLHDTSEITYKRSEPREFGLTRKIPCKGSLFSTEKTKTVCGILMHSSLVVTTEGLPLGLAAKKFWNREKFKNAKSLYRSKNGTRIPLEEKESYRWVESLRNSNELLDCQSRLIHVGDREADIYDFFNESIIGGSNFLVRIKVDRKTSEHSTINRVMGSAPSRGQHELSYTDAKGIPVKALLEIKFEKVTIQPSSGLKRDKFDNLAITIIHANECSNESEDREPISWKLATNLQVEDLESAIEKLKWYSLRWRIETFFKVLKSGCKVEESKIRNAESLSKLIALNCIIAWRIFWLTMINREVKDIPAEIVLSEVETKLLDKLVPDNSPKKTSSLQNYLIKIAKLGGYLARASDPPPGNTVVWRGIKRLLEAQIGFELGLGLMGN